MKSFVVAVCIFAVAAATGLDKDAQVLRSVFDFKGDGGYNYAYESDNGIAGQASAAVKAVGKEIALEVTGSNQYKTPTGEIIQLSYIANENGYQPQGAHLPTPPAPEPIPEYILRSLEYIEKHPYVEKKL